MNVGEFRFDPAAFEGPQAGIHLELAPNELPIKNGARAIVREAIIPFVVWPDVPLRVLEARQLGRMEIFLLNAGLDLQRFTFDDLTDATDVPAQVIAASAEKLLRRQAFVEIQPGEYAVDERRATQMLATKNIEEEHLRLMTLVYFPRQDLVIANQDIARQLLGVTKKLRAPYQAPYRPDIDRSKSVSNFIASRIAVNRVFGHANRILGIEPWSKPSPWPKVAPCYYARGFVDGAGDVAVANIQLWGLRKREFHAENVQFVGVSPLIQEWVSLTDSFRKIFRGSVSGLPALEEAFLEAMGKPLSWRLWVTQAEAVGLAENHWLTETLPISICTATAKVDVRLSFEPMDRQAAALFALDIIALRIDDRRRSYSEREWTEDIRVALERYPDSAGVHVTRDLIEERLWRLKRFLAVYQHRATEDFAYA